MDAVNPGGSGDPYAELNEEERAALREATLLGYPLRGWWNHETLTSGYFYNVAPLMPMLDPTYVDDFWTKPGYLGSDPTSSIAANASSSTRPWHRVIDGFPKQVELASAPDRDFADAHLVIMSGAAAGKSVPIAAIDGKTIGFAFAADQAAINGIQPGDQVRIDNSWALALQTYHRHQVPTPDMYGWNQFRGADGQPIYPQRDVLIGPIGAAGTAGSVPNGRIHGKMLVLECLMDIDALAWQADWYRITSERATGRAFRRQLRALVHRSRATRQSCNDSSACPYCELRRRAAASIARSERVGREGRESLGHAVRGGRRAGQCAGQRS